MVINKGVMKRKRKEGCSSPVIEESPKRTKVHAQRKFAQGSNVNSPVLTPVPDNEKEEVLVMPEPVELLPIKRPNTEDFLTFLCFRGTPILPPNLNFFNTASIVDTNGQIHEIKSESPKNGPIDTSTISKAGSGSADRPFIAFGVRKRADPIVISRQMDKKRRHALALQALRRKYQEQRMAKIRAVTISKLSEKVTNKTLVRSNSVSKTEATVTKKTQAVQKTNNKVSVVATKHVKVTTQTVKTTLRPQIKPKMCLRSFRGRFVQKELQFRNVKKTNLSTKKITKKIVKQSVENNDEESDDELSTDDDDDETESSSDEVLPEVVIPKVAKKSAPGPKKPSEINFRITRSNKIMSSKITSRRQQMKQLILTTPKTLVKPRTLRSHTAQKGDSPKSKLEQRLLQMRKQKEMMAGKVANKSTPQKEKEVCGKSETTAKGNNKEPTVNKKVTNTKTTDNKSPENLKKTAPNNSNKGAKGATKVDNTKTESKIIETLKRKEQERIKLSPANKKSEEKSPPTKSPEIKPKIKVTPTNKKEITKLKKDLPKTGNKTTDPPAISAINKDKVKEESAMSLKKDVKSSELEQRTCQRPTRKTKEAAAIYMEILSHKLVNDSKIDDEDDVSIDSFPELPNVKKTEQRENELKAKARKSDSDSDKKVVESKTLRSVDKKKKTEEADSVENKEERKDVKKNEDVKDVKKEVEVKNKPKPEEVCDRKTRSSNQPTSFKHPTEAIEVKKIAKDGAKRKIVAKPEDKSESDQDQEDARQTKMRKSEEAVKKEEVGTVTRSNNKNASNSTKDEDVKKVTKSEYKKDDVVTRRQTRNSSQQVRSVDEEISDDSDESFRVDVKVPRKKQNTRSKVCTKSYDSDSSSDSFEKVLRVSSSVPIYKDSSSGSESDDSSTSEALKPKTPPSVKTKKLTKTPSRQKSEKSFSDSDEEPLSKLIEDNAKKDDSVVTAKPKRECAKRPQNYLPMFSSSDEEERFFCGFQSKEESPIVKPIEEEQKIPKTEETAVPTLDLSLKDIGRRFGKGKVNMSTEQIEKWLKDSAMAGSSNISKENDSMLKFGEKIPTETLLNNATNIDTQRLKTLLLSDTVNKTSSSDSVVKISPEKVSMSKNVIVTKPVMIDRKLMFRKDKVAPPPAPSANAFSPNNESSVYAFGEETDDVIMKTPFRRPSRRPSSTATSRSEDELSKSEDQSKLGHFRMPLVSDDVVLNLSNQKLAMVPPPMKPAPKHAPVDEFKYKVPSSPSASSSSSAKLYKRQKLRMVTTPTTSILMTPEVSPVVLPNFPISAPNLVEAPTFYPTEKEFQDPIEYIEKLRFRAEQFGICRIVPPATFKPECKVTDDMRFTAYNQYVHKMLHRWGPNFKELMAIRKYLSTQNISLTHPPWIGGMEIDLPRLYQTVQSLGGLKEVIEKKKWPRVSDAMKIPKSAQDRVTKLDDIYCKYLLPYDTLSPVEREKLFDEVETDWAKRESKSLLKMQQAVQKEDEDSESDSDNEAEECIIKGRNMALNAFYRIARNTMSMWFRTPEPPAQEVEQEFWKHVTLRQNHICVHSGSIDSGNWGYGFAVSKNSPFARHSWNLKVLTNNSGSVLRSLGPIMGVTVPTLHVGMVFSSCCWYRDPHSLPWVEYLHTGGNKIWYGIPDSASASFQTALKKIVPNYCHNKTLWLPSDTVMVPPNLLVENGVSLCRIVQEPGQFIVVFPKAFTSSLSTGYVVSESVYFAPPYWLKNAKSFFDELRNNCEPSMFSLERLLLSIVGDSRSSVEVLRQILPAVEDLCNLEKTKREKIKNLGVGSTERLPLPEAPNARKKKKLQDDDDDYECEICRMNLFISMIETDEDGFYCLDHAIEQLEMQTFPAKNCKFLYAYDDKELAELVSRIHSSIENKLQKKIPNKYAGMPTLLTK